MNRELLTELGRALGCPAETVPTASISEEAGRSSAPSTKRRRALPGALYYDGPALTDNGDAPAPSPFVISTPRLDQDQRKLQQLARERILRYAGRFSREFRERFRARKAARRIL
jgi:hypothetical protein